MNVNQALILILVMALAAFAGYHAYMGWTSAGNVSTYEYDQYVPVSEIGAVVSLSGPAELTSVGETSYIHFTDLGRVKIGTPAGIREYEIVPATLQLIMLSGQSNAVLFTAPQNWTGEYPEIAPGTVYIFGHEEADPSKTALAKQDNIDECGIIDLVKPSGDLRLAQMYPVLAVDLTLEKNARYLIINTAISGRAIMWWDDGALCDDYALELTAAVKEDAGEHYNLNPIAVLWSQGESDASRTQEYYFNRFIRLTEKFTSGYYSGFKFPGVICSLPKQTDHIGGPMIPPALAQIQASETYDYIKVSSTLAYSLTAEQMRPDGAHYKQIAFNWFAEAYARSVAEFYGWKPVPETTVLVAGDPSEESSTITGIGTSGAAYYCRIDWDLDSGEGVIIPPAGKRIRPEIEIIIIEEPDSDPVSSE